MFYIMQNDLVATENIEGKIAPVPPFKKFTDAEAKVIELAAISRRNFTITQVIAVVTRPVPEVNMVT